MSLETSNNEISIKELFKLISNWFSYLIQKWKTITIVSLLFAIIGFTYAKFIHPHTYTAKLTFVLSSDGKASGGLSALAGSLGVDMGGGIDGAFAGENIIQMLESYKMVERAMLKPVPGTNISLLNAITESFFVPKKWKKERLKSALPFPNSAINFTPLQDSLARAAHTYILKEFLTVSRVDKKLSFYKVTVTSPNAVFSKYLTSFLVEEASKFYIEIKTKQARKNLDMLQREADSLRYVLGYSISDVATGTDAIYNLNPALQKARIETQKSQVQAQVLATAYGEVVKNLEVAKVTLQKETPLYQLIDEPSKLPVKNKLSGLISGIVGAFVGFMLTALFLILKKVTSGA